MTTCYKELLSGWRSRAEGLRHSDGNTSPARTSILAHPALLTTASASAERRSGGMNFLRSLAEQWREDAAILRRYRDERGAHVAEMLAEELEAALQELQRQALSLQEAEAESGYTRGHLRRMLSDGTIPNAGTERDPLILRGDLPRKPGHGVAPAVPDTALSRTQVARAVASGD